MAEYRIFGAYVLTVLGWVLLTLMLAGCGGGPTAPTTVTHTADIDPPLLNPDRVRDLTFPDWMCNARFVQDPGPEFRAECKRRGL